MRNVRFLMLICAVAILASSVALASSRTPSRIAVCGIISAVDATAATLTVTPPAPPANSRCAAQPPVTFGLISTTKISLDDDTADIAALTAGQWCTAALIKAANGSWTAQRVCATTPFLIGRVTAIDANANIITIQPPSPCFRRPVPTVQFQVTDKTTFVKNGSVTLADVLMGDVVRITFLEPADPTTMAPAIQIEVLPDDFCGKATAVDATAGTITVLGGRTTLTFNVDPSATIKRSRSTATLADILVGDSIGVDYFHMTGDALLAVDLCATPPVVRGRPRR